MSRTFEYDVFLSYSSKDKKTVHALAERLKKDGLRVWLDEWAIKPGDLIGLEIQHGLEKSRTLIMCMSSAYFDSEWAKLEHQTLLFRDPTNKQRRFIPFLIEDCTRPDIIAQFAYVDLRTPSGNAYLKLVAACRVEETSLATFQESIYQKNNLFFKIPAGWNVIKDGIEKNDKEIVISDGTNSIRIDLLEYSGIGKLIGDYLINHLSKSEFDSLPYDTNNPTGNSWFYAYEKYPWYSNDAICGYYKENIIKPTALGGKGIGSGISVLPDGVEYAEVSTNADSHKSINEWVIAWTKPNYDNEIIGVHSLFKGEFREMKVEWHGSNAEYIMPEPLWTMLTTLNRGNRQPSKATTPSYLDDV